MILPAGCPAQASEAARWNEVRRQATEYLRSPSPEVQLRGVELLGATSHLEATRMLLHLLERLARSRSVPDPGLDRVWEAAEEALAHTRLPAAVDLVIEEATLSSAWQVRAACVRVLGQLGTELAHLALLAASADESPLVRVATARALGSRTSRGSTDEVGVLGALLLDGHWQVRAAAISSLGQLARRDGVEPLIRRLEEEEGRLEEDLLSVLTRLTGLELHPEEWESWWQANGAQWVRGGKGGLPAGHPGPVLQDPDQQTSTFYGIPVRTRRPLFIIDVSGSMGSRAEGLPERQPPPVSTPSSRSRSSTLPEPRLPPEPTRLDVARYELHRAIATLPEDAEFTVLVFSTDHQQLGPDRFRGTPLGKREAIELLYRLEPGGGTNSHGVLRAALELAGAGLLAQGKLLPQGSDTVFFLTDGLPTVGETTDPTAITAMVTGCNSHLGLRVHTVGVGTSSMGPGEAGRATRFLQQLAVENEGTCVIRP